MGRRGGGGWSSPNAARLSAGRVTHLTKQAFKMFFRCQEPRGQWDDGERSRMCVELAWEGGEDECPGRDVRGTSREYPGDVQ